MYIDEFTLLYPLETGAFSTVWRVKHNKNNKSFALKMISKEKYKTKVEKRNLKMEIKIHKQLRHENVIKMYNSFEDDFFMYIILELGNEDLYHFNTRRGDLTDNEILNISYQIIKGLVYLKKKNIIHGDLKPENILMVGNKAKICDFGLSTQNTFHFNYVGTPEFMAPEIIKRKMYNHKIDVWSFGIILYIMVYGESPFYSKRSRSETEYAICYKKVDLKKDSIFNDIISKCLQKHDINRPTIEELYENEIFSNMKI